MVWYLYAFSAAFFESLKSLLSKKSLKNIDEYVVGWSFRFVSLLFLLVFFFLFDKVPSLGEHFFLTLVVSGSLMVITTILYMKALKESDLSLTMPMVTFTPLFLLVTSPILLGEFPDIFGQIGVVLIVLGSYLLNIMKAKEGFFAPFKALITDKGPRYMLIVSFIWSITANLEKIGMQNSSILFWSLSVHIFVVIFLFPIMLLKAKKSKAIQFKDYKFLVLIGFFSALSIISILVAINMTYVSYAVAIKRISVILSVLFGYLFFKEKGIKERLLGSAIMVLGVLFITCF